MLCPGPHLHCQGCFGQGRVAEGKHYVGMLPTSELPGESTCYHCRGVGAFCQNRDSCGGRKRTNHLHSHPPV
jgi:hypothetical protein